MSGLDDQAPAPADADAPDPGEDSEPRFEMRRALRDATEAAGRGEWRRVALNLALLSRLESATLPDAEIFRRAAALGEVVSKKRRLRINRIALVTVFLLTGVSVVLLFLVPVGSVRISADIRASELALDGRTSWTLEDMPVERVELSGVQSAVAETPSGSHTLQATSPASQVTVTSAALVLDRLQVDAETAGLELLDGNGFRLAASTSAMTGGLNGPMKVVVSDMTATPPPLGAPDRLDLPNGTLLTFEAKAITAAANVHPRARESTIIARNVSIERIRFASREVDRAYSAIEGGTLTLADFKDEVVTLHPGDLLSLSGSGLRATRIVFEKGGFHIWLTGDVTVLKANSLQLKPSMLAWATQHRDVTLIVGALVSALSIAWLLLSRLEILRT
jgi:hypothetical protein